MRRVRETLIAVGTADDQFADSAPANDPPWMAYYDAAQHNGDTGHALFDLAVQGRSGTEATTRLTAAAAGHTAAFTRSRAIAATKLASLTMVIGDPSQAAATGHAALDTAATIRSHRAADDLRELARYALRHQQLREVAALRQRINNLILAS
ncbi:MAG: hypothetical protein ACRDTE_30745 [Pseudonocardiaceae bacterium]